MTLFTAKVPEDTVVRLQKEEISMAAWLDYAAARKRLTYLNLKQALDNSGPIYSESRTIVIKIGRAQSKQKRGHDIAGHGSLLAFDKAF